jgi:hypothetical protein
MMKTAQIALFMLVIIHARAVADPSISRERAHQLVRMYCLHYFWSPLRGVATLPVQRGEYWESTLLMGTRRVPRGTIRIHRRTSIVSFDGSALFKPSISADSLERWVLDQRSPLP